VVSDVWRGGAQAVRDEGDLADPNGVFGVVRDAIRAADRVVWLRRDAPRRILVFDVQDATGAGDGPALARAWNDSLRALAARTPGVTPVTDSAARAPVDVMERRMAAERSGAGASVAVSLGRRRDSLLVRVTVRDVTAESNSPTLELRSPLSEPFGVLDGVRQFIADQLAKVTWRPKGLP